MSERQGESSDVIRRLQFAALRLPSVHPRARLAH
jgi:hypothetical protein